jgi:hypothetical protein
LTKGLVNPARHAGRVAYFILFVCPALPSISRPASFVDAHLYVRRHFSFVLRRVITAAGSSTRQALLYERINKCK